jgi:hypothetical protein
MIQLGEIQLAAAERDRVSSLLGDKVFFQELLNLAGELPGRRGLAKADDDIASSPEMMQDDRPRAWVGRLYGFFLGSRALRTPLISTFPALASMSRSRIPPPVASSSLIATVWAARMPVMSMPHDASWSEPSCSSAELSLATKTIDKPRARRSQTVRHDVLVFREALADE